MNNYGFHGPPVTVEKPQGVFRIVVIGSSYVEARQVTIADMFSTHLEQLLNADPNRTHTYEVIPLGFNGNSMYYKYYGSLLTLDLVIDIESGYELLQNLDTPPLDPEGNAILEAPKKEESIVGGSVRELLRHSKLLVDLYSRFLIFKNASLTFLEAPLFFMVSSSTPAITESKILSITDQEVLQSAYDAYAKALVNRRLAVPVNAVAQAVEIAREDGTQIRKKPAEIIDNSFAEQLDKSGFLKELWGNELPQR